MHLSDLKLKSGSRRAHPPCEHTVQHYTSPPNVYPIRVAAGVHLWCNVSRGSHQGVRLIHVKRFRPRPPSISLLAFFMAIQVWRVPRC